MADQVTVLDEAIPDDIIFEIKGQRLEVPGDLDTEEILSLYKLFRELTADQVDANDDEAVLRAAHKVDETLLALFKLRQPDLEKLPFGAVGKRAVIRKLLETMGVIRNADEPSLELALGNLEQTIAHLTALGGHDEQLARLNEVAEALRPPTRLSSPKPNRAARRARSSSSSRK